MNVDALVVYDEVAYLGRRAKRREDLDRGPEPSDLDEAGRYLGVVEAEDGGSREQTQTKTSMNATSPIS